MLLYRAINQKYINPEKYKDSRSALEEKFSELIKSTGSEFKAIQKMNSGDVKNLFKLRIAKRLGYFGTDKEKVMKNINPSGTLLIINVPETELHKYIPQNDPGINAFLKYGEVYFFPDDAPYTPEIINL